MQGVFLLGTELSDQPGGKAMDGPRVLGEILPSLASPFPSSPVFALISSINY